MKISAIYMLPTHIDIWRGSVLRCYDANAKRIERIQRAVKACQDRLRSQRSDNLLTEYRFEN